MLITVDCGATNMRCRLFDRDILLDEVKCSCGTRNAAFAGSNAPLKEALRDLINELLKRNRITPAEVEMIVSAGTLASNAGLYHVPHAQAPIGIAESATNAKAVVLSDVTSIPMLFIPGVRTAPTGDETDPLYAIELYDSMGGEECECYGISAALGLTGDYVMVMPGSYCQTFSVDGDGRITSVFTCMCGDLIAAVAEHTFLKSTLPTPVIREINADRLLEGFRYCDRNGTSNALIKSRMIHVWGGYTLDEAANFLVGAILHDNILAAARRAQGKRVILGGGEPLREVFRLLLTHAGVKALTVVDDETARLASSRGALAVYRAWRSAQDQAKS